MEHKCISRMEVGLSLRCLIQKQFTDTTTTAYPNAEFLSFKFECFCYSSIIFIFLLTHFSPQPAPFDLGINLSLFCVTHVVLKYCYGLFQHFILASVRDIKTMRNWNKKIFSLPLLPLLIIFSSSYEKKLKYSISEREMRRMCGVRRFNKTWFLSSSLEQ